MIYRPYGKTGIDVSAIGCGGMRFPDWNNLEENARLLLHAYDQGINYFDTAPGYGGGKSEEAFGLAFQEMKKTRRERPFYVSTKSAKKTASEVREDIETSLKRMNLDVIDFYHVWWVVRPKWYFDRKTQGAIDEFVRLKEEGLVRHICLSSHMRGEDAREVLDDFPFDGILLGYSAMNFPYREASIEQAAAADRGVAVMNPLAGGMIPQNADRFGFLKTQKDETVVEAALRFLLNDPRITMTLVGFSDTGQVDEAVRAVDGFRPIPESEISRIRDTLGKEFDDICTGCGYCMPCPEGVPVAELMQSWNAKLFQNKPGALIHALKYYQVLFPRHGIEKCVACGECEERCTQQLPIIERLKAIRAEADRVAEEEGVGEKKVRHR